MKTIKGGLLLVFLSLLVNAMPIQGSVSANLQSIRDRISQIQQEAKKETDTKKVEDTESLVGLETVDVDIADIEKIKEDRFTQSEAHLSLYDIRKLIKKHYPVEMYLNTISQAIAKEQQYLNTHYAFYHALDNVWIATQDVYRKLHTYLFPMSTRLENFQFLRWGFLGYEGTAQEFLVDQLKNHGLVDDNLGAVKAFLLSVNLALFGNVGHAGECTWHYFMYPTSHATPNEDIYKSILDVFGVDHKWVKSLMKLSDLLKTREQTLLQIMIPIDKVDEIAYLSLLRGIPAHAESMDWILKNVKSKKFKDMQPVLDKLTQIYKSENVKNPMFKRLLEQAQGGDFSVHNLLKVYRNTPWKIKNLNYLQARLILTRDTLLNPASGVKFFKYSTVTRKQKEQYDKELDKLIGRIVDEFLKKRGRRR